MKKYLIDLTDDERAVLQALVRRGKTQARKVTRARILLHANRGASDSEIVTVLGVGLATVERTRRRFVEEGLEALNERARPGARPRLSEKPRHGWWPKLAAQPLKGVSIGQCAFWLDGSSSWGSPTLARMRPLGAC